MFERLAQLEVEYLETEAQLADPSVISNQPAYRAATRRYSELGSVVSAYRHWRGLTDDLAVARELFAESDGAEREDMRSQIAAYEAELSTLEDEIKILLLPRDANEGKSVIMEIRGAEGGEEANLFARDLFSMYQGFAQRRGWKFEILSADVSELGGYNQVTFLVSGDDAWSHLKYEGGPHRVQRVPVTESQGRVHTSSATVAVLAEAEEVDVDIDQGDLQIDVYRSSGAGGQSVNTTDSAVRITHLPSGLVVTMQDERSQLQNRARAMQVLRSRLLQLEQDRQASATAAERRSQVGGGGRSEKIRTYNYKENRITDHRIGLTLYQLSNVLGGDLDPVVEALITEERTRQLTESSDV